MGFRRKRADIPAKRRWERFVTENATLILEAGLPIWITDDEDCWGDILHYGYPEQVYGEVAYSLPPFKVEKITEAQFQAFIRLLEIYYEAGFYYGEPLGIKQRSPKEFRRLVNKFGPASSRVEHSE